MRHFFDAYAGDAMKRVEPAPNVRSLYSMEAKVPRCQYSTWSGKKNILSLPKSIHTGTTLLSTRYVRKDGGPDRRFNNNRELPIMLYGVVTAVSSRGLNLLIHTSNSTAAESFANSFKAFQGTRDDRLFGEPGQTERTEWTGNKRQATSSVPANIQRAMEVLGLTSSATLEEVAVAYHHMAQMYHPDKVAGLGPELQKLAEDQMKEINAAHSILRTHFEGA